MTDKNNNGKDPFFPTPVKPNNLDPNQFPNVSYPPQQTWYDYWRTHQPIVFATPWTGFISSGVNTTTLDGIIAASKTGGGGGGNPGNPTSTPSRETGITEITWNETTMTEEAFEDLILNDIGGRELLTLSRHDSLIGTTFPKYSPIKNIASVLFQNSPINIAPNPNSTIDYFDTFAISLSSYIPLDSEIEALSQDYEKSYVYYESSTNSIIINAANIFNNENVEVDFVTFNSLNDDTIYT